MDTRKQKIYTVTILNDASLSNQYALAHTWLKFMIDNKKPTYFMFKPSEVSTALKNIEVTGKIETSKTIKNRKATSLFKIQISEAAYNKMMRKIQSLQEQQIRFKLFPEQDKNYNSTTAAIHVLNTGGVGLRFQKLVTPFGLENEIEASGKNYGYGVYLVDLIDECILYDVKDNVEKIYNWYYGDKEHGSVELIYGMPDSDLVERYEEKFKEKIKECFGDETVWHSYKNQLSGISREVYKEIVDGLTYQILKKIPLDTLIVDPEFDTFYIEHPDYYGSEGPNITPVKKIKLVAKIKQLPIIAASKDAHNFFLTIKYPNRKDAVNIVIYSDRRTEEIDKHLESVEIYTQDPRAETIINMEPSQTLSMSYLMNLANKGSDQDDFIQGWKHIPNTINGQKGDDTIEGGRCDDTLNGGPGDDYISGNEGHDILIGGLGNDYLEGGSGNDTYIFNLGDGHDTIFDESGDLDVIKFGKGILPNKILVKREEDNLLLIINNKNSITVELYFYENEYEEINSIEQIIFADGTIWTKDDILSKVQSK